MTDASYNITEGDTSGNFYLPGSVNVTYTCNEGYKFQHPQNFTVGCEYVSVISVITKAMWTSTDGIICVPGQYITSALLGLITCGREPP